MSAAYFCSRCKRSLIKPAVSSGGLVLGRVCARKLVVEIVCGEPKTKPAPKLPPKVVQLDLFTGVAA